MDISVSKSKPDKPGELRNVNVNSISLVSKAANRKTYRIFKMDKSVTNPPTPNGSNAQATEAAPEPVTKDERGLFHVLKSFFMGDENVEKGAVADIVEAQDNGQKLDRAIGALFTVLGLSRWGDPNSKPETDPAKIRAALTDFKNVAEDILIGKDEDVKKAVEEVQKSGRKISGPRLAKIKEVHAILSDIIADTESTEGEASNVSKEELEAVVKTSVDEAIQPINARLDKLEKGEGGTDADPATPQGTTPASSPDAPDVGAIVKEAVEKAMGPIQERLDKVEKARGFSNRQPEDTSVRKDGDGMWGNIF